MQLAGHNAACAQDSPETAAWDTCLAETGSPLCSAKTLAAPSTASEAACRPLPGCASFMSRSMLGVTRPTAASIAPSTSARTWVGKKKVSCLSNAYNTQGFKTHLQGVTKEGNR
jgi:hypothetical protein